MIWPNKIKINVESDFMGHLVLTPIRDIYCKYIREYMKIWKIETDGSAYIQLDYDIEQFLNDYCSKESRRMLESGWDITIKIDPWIFCHYHGWDCHTIVEGGLTLSQIKEG
jgi:hypothetical protein